VPRQSHDGKSAYRVAGRSAFSALRLMNAVGYRHISIVENGNVAGVVSGADFRGLQADRLDEETGLRERIRYPRGRTQWNGDSARSIAASAGCSALVGQGDHSEGSVHHARRADRAT